MKRALFVAIAASSSLVATSALARGPEYKFAPVDYPGAAATFVSAINDYGHLAGQFAPPGGVGHAMYGEIGHLAPVDPDGVVGKSAFSAAYTLNNVGVVAGSYGSDPTVFRGDHGYLMRGAEIVSVQYPGGLPTEIYGVNDLGQAVGGYFTPDGNVHAFEFAHGSFEAEDVPGALTTVPLSINDLGQIVGFYVTAAGGAGRGYVREPNGAIRTFDAPGAPPDSTQLLYVDDRDDMLGFFVDGSGNTVNFLRSGGAFETLEAPAAIGPTASTGIFYQAINDFGIVAGFFTDPSGAFHGFVGAPSR